MSEFSGALGFGASGFRACRVMELGSRARQCAKFCLGFEGIRV